MPRRRLIPVQPTSIELAFDQAWRILGGPELAWQFAFAPPHRHRWDRAHPASRVAIDLQGGIWVNGWHQNPVRYRADAAKLNLASSLGWRVWHLTTDMIRDDPVGTLGPIIAATKWRLILAEQE